MRLSVFLFVCFLHVYLSFTPTRPAPPCTACRLDPCWSAVEATATKDGQIVHRMRVADETGSILFTLWGEAGQAACPGDILRIRGGYGVWCAVMVGAGCLLVCLSVCLFVCLFVCL